MAEAKKSLRDQLLDLMVYAPAGFVLSATGEIPTWADKGRQQIGQHVANAHFIGQFIVTKAERDLKKRFGPSPSASPAPEPSDLPETVEVAPVPEPPTPSSNGHVPASVPEVDVVDADSAIVGYDELSASQVVRRLDALDRTGLDIVFAYESAQRGRRTILHRTQELLAGRAAETALD